MMSPAELELFTASVRRAVAGSSGGALDTALDELGWDEALQAAPIAAIDALFFAQGREGATSGALHRVLAAGLGLDPAASVPVLLPAAASALAPGAVCDGTLSVNGLLLGSAAGTDSVLVVAGSQMLQVATASLALGAVQGLDPAVGLITVRGEVAAPSVARTGDWATAVASGQLALSYELIGAGRAMLALAREHALSRVQFGATISSFQAVRHRLAETHVALESAAGLSAAAAEDGSPVLAAMAKAVAGRAARTATRHCQQVLAGIGFTTEHTFHLYLRRALLLDQLLGSTEVLTRELGASLLASVELPALLPL